MQLRANVLQGDGVYRSDDGGRTWRHLGLDHTHAIGRIRVHPTDPDRAYVAALGHPFGVNPQRGVFRTTDGGRTWERVLFRDDRTGAVDLVMDPNDPHVLYATLWEVYRTEHGVYVSFDDGARWTSLSYDLPDTPVTGLSVEERDLVISTHGRSFWVLDDVETLRQIEAGVATADAYLFEPADAIRRSVPAVIDYHLAGADRNVRLDVLDAEGGLVRTLFEGTRDEGTHRATWNLRYAGAVTFDGIVLEGGNPTVGPWAPPGPYQARLTVDGDELVASLQVLRDPRLSGVSDADLVAQFELARAIRDAESEANGGVLLIRDLREQIETSVEGSDDREVRGSAGRFLEEISAIEANLYQVMNQSPKDKIAFPIRLNDRLTGLRNRLERGDAAPTDAYRAVFEELSAELDGYMGALDDVVTDELSRLNEHFTRAGLPRNRGAGFWMN